MVRVLVLVAYAACVITLWAFISLAVDRDAITQSDAGPLLGPSIVLAATLATALQLRRRARPGWNALLLFGAAASAYLAMLVIGSLGYYLVTARPGSILQFVLADAASPFIIGAALLSAFAVGAGRLFDRPGARG